MTGKVPTRSIRATRWELRVWGTSYGVISKVKQSEYVAHSHSLNTTKVCTTVHAAAQWIYDNHDVPRDGFAMTAEELLLLRTLASGITQTRLSTIVALTQDALAKRLGEVRKRYGLHKHAGSRLLCYALAHYDSGDRCTAERILRDSSVRPVRPLALLLDAEDEVNLRKLVQDGSMPRAEAMSALYRALGFALPGPGKGQAMQLVVSYALGLHDAGQTDAALTYIEEHAEEPLL